MLCGHSGLEATEAKFLSKCGSDIHNNTMLQWRKWRESSSDVVSMQMEAAMETALIEVASHYVNVIQALKDSAMMLLLVLQKPLLMVTKMRYERNLRRNPC